ncbi:MAG: glucosamine-6-phosphate deaminase [Bacteroidales bacterium]|nr:glucosamine-6-phosphate deaminase [Bacteroidales bacterium]
MKTNLSSQIKLDRVPKRYYAPDNVLELTALTRFEKVFTEVFESADGGAAHVAKKIAAIIEKCNAENRKCVMALGWGLGTHAVYNELVEMHKANGFSFANTVIFNVSEFYPATKGEKSSLSVLKEIFLEKVDINPENIFSPEATDNVFEFCKQYEETISKLGGLDITLLELGRAGALSFNEPGSQLSSTTRLMLLSKDSQNLISKVFQTNDKGVTSAITMGISTLLNAKETFVVGWGEEVASSLKKAVEGPISDAVPASFLQTVKRARFVVDLAAAEKLTRISKPWLVSSCEWTDQLIRRAIVWLCNVTNKPILKLTNKDYNDHGLSELLALYKSAYEVNIKIFNDLQHTITGWPGGKPNADDTYRPERAKPYPKKVIVFSPHPDDDVISMGGTLQRLVNQKHDVHVAYETSGNIAVGDEDMMRYVLLMNSIAEEFEFATPGIKERLDAITASVATKKDGDMDIPEARYMKGMIRRAEARTACAYVGVKPENVHFLALPFYETGTIKKGTLGRADVDIVKKLLLDVKPDQMFVAGDLADPHGTHRVCLDAVLAAIDEVKDEEWMKNCKVWMYRGAWAEWDIDYIEMAVPISPEELRQKRNSILKHQSQMENAPFLGNDERLFWQRAEDRNKATAELYSKLGLASYEAIEAFVEYHPIR